MAIEMGDTEISRRLALAIGYAPKEVRVVSGKKVAVLRGDRWSWFGHRDERTIFRIAARYNLFPRWSPALKQWAITREYFFVYEHCPATCIALATIEASERGLL